MSLGLLITSPRAPRSLCSQTYTTLRENADRLAGEPAPDPDDPVALILDDLESAAALEGSSRLAYALHEKLVAALRSENRGVKQAPFYVLAGARKLHHIRETAAAADIELRKSDLTRIAADLDALGQPEA